MLKTLFQRLFQRQSVDAILASFTSTIKRLEAAAERHAEEAIQHAVAAAESEGKRNVANFQAARAAGAAQRLRDMFSGPALRQSAPRTGPDQPD